MFPRRGVSLSIEVACNFSRRPAGSKSSEDPANDLGLFLDNLQFTAMTWDDAISIWSTACVPPRANDASHTATHFFGTVLTLHLPDQAADADKNGVGGFVMNRIDLNPEER